jgi:hypothetical protein
VIPTRTALPVAVTAVPRDRVGDTTRDGQRGAHRRGRADHRNRVLARHRLAIDDDPAALGDEVGRRDDPDGASRGAGDLHGFRPGAAQFLDRLEHRGGLDGRPARDEPDPQPLALSGKSPGQDAELVGAPARLGERRLPPLRAGAELGQRDLQRGDLGAEPLLPRVEVGQDAHQVVLAGVVELGVAGIALDLHDEREPEERHQQADDRAGGRESFSLATRHD